MAHPSAQPDQFVHDRLPTREALPTFNYDTPELQIADQANLVQALFEQAERAGHGDRPCCAARTAATATERRAPRPRALRSC